MHTNDHKDSVVGGRQQAKIVEILDITSTLAAMGISGWAKHVMTQVPPGRLDPLEEDPRRGGKPGNSLEQAAIVFQLVELFRMGYDAREKDWCPIFDGFVEDDRVIVSTDSFSWRRWGRKPHRRTVQKCLTALCKRGYISVEFIYRKAAFVEGKLKPELHRQYFEKVGHYGGHGVPHHGGLVQRIQIHWDKIAEELLYVGKRACYPRPTKICETLDGQQAEADRVERLRVVVPLPYEGGLWTSVQWFEKSPELYYKRMREALETHPEYFQVSDIVFYTPNSLDSLRARKMVGCSTQEFFARFENCTSVRSMEEKAAGMSELGYCARGTFGAPNRYYFPAQARRWILRDLGLLRGDNFPDRDGVVIAFNAQKKQFEPTSFSFPSQAAPRVLCTETSGNPGVYTLVVPSDLKLRLREHPTSASRYSPGETAYWLVRPTVGDKRPEDFVSKAFFSKVKARISDPETRFPEELNSLMEPNPDRTLTEMERLTRDLLKRGARRLHNWGSACDWSGKPYLDIPTGLFNMYLNGEFDEDPPFPETPDQTVNLEAMEACLYACSHLMGDADRMRNEFLHGQSLGKGSRKTFVREFDKAFRAITETFFYHPTRNEWKLPTQDDGMLNPLTMSWLAAAVKRGLRAEHIHLFRVFVNRRVGSYERLFVQPVVKDAPLPEAATKELLKLVLEGSMTLGGFLTRSTSEVIPLLLAELQARVTEITYRTLVVYHKSVAHHLPISPELRRVHRGVWLHFVSKFQHGMAALYQMTHMTLNEGFCCPQLGGGNIPETHSRMHRYSPYILPTGVTLTNGL